MVNFRGVSKDSFLTGKVEPSLIEYTKLEKTLKEIVLTNKEESTIPLVIEKLARAEHVSRNEAISTMWRLVDKGDFRYGRGVVSINAKSEDL